MEIRENEAFLCPGSLDGKNLKFLLILCLNLPTHDFI